MTADLSRDETRQHQPALDAASRLFAAGGGRGLGMAEITDEIIRSTGTDIIEFRRAFPTRLDLLYTVVLRSTRALVNGQTAVADTSAAPDIRLAHLIRRHIDYCWEHRTEEELRRELMPTLRSIHPARHRELSELLRRYRAHIRAIIGHGLDDSVFRVRYSDTAAGSVLETLESILNWYEPQGGLSLRELGDVYVDLVVHHQLGAPRT